MREGREEAYLAGEKVVAAALAGRGGRGGGSKWGLEKEGAHSPPPHLVAGHTLADRPLPFPHRRWRRRRLSSRQFSCFFFLSFLFSPSFPEMRSSSSVVFQAHDCARPTGSSLGCRALERQLFPFPIERHILPKAHG